MWLFHTFVFTVLIFIKVRENSKLLYIVHSRTKKLGTHVTSPTKDYNNNPFSRSFWGSIFIVWHKKLWNVWCTADVLSLICIKHSGNWTTCNQCLLQILTTWAGHDVACIQSKQSQPKAWELFVWGQLGLQSEFYVSLRYIGGPCSKHCGLGCSSPVKHLLTKHVQGGL